MGHATGRAADLLALWTVVLAESLDAEECLAGDIWGLEWWQQVEVYLPIALGSLAAEGKPVPREDLPPMLFMHQLPDESPPTTPEARRPNPLRGPTSVDIEAIRAENARFDKEVEFMAQAEREVRQQQRMEEEEAEWMEGVRKREMEQEEQALEQHRAREAQAYDDWAMWDELRRGPGMQARKRKVLHIEMAPGSADRPRVAQAISVPLLNENEAEINLRIHMQQELMEERRDHGCCAKYGELPDSAGFDEDGLPQDVTMEQYFELYDSWRMPGVSDSEIVARYGRVVLELFQNQLLLTTGAEEDTLELRHPHHGEGLGTRLPDTVSDEPETREGA